MSNYLQAVSSQIPNVISVLEAKGIEPRSLEFGGELPIEKKIYVPTDARSEFLANRAMGDWAEDSLSRALTKGLPATHVVKYGDSDATAAGEEGFKEQYLKAKEDTRIYGKRPDLLLFKDNISVKSDITDLPREVADDFARKAELGIEVRSSKQQALKYMAVKREDGLTKGKAAGKIGLSFTVKVEDLKIVYRWLEVCRIPQIYSQVFFDSVFAINVLDIFRTIGSGSGFTIDKPDKSQNKATIMIPITNGVQIAHFATSPQFDVEIKENRTGRIDAFVKPVGGDLVLDQEAFRQLLI